MPSFLCTRSFLFTPATHPERFEKAKAVEADVLIVDLEDSVSPEQKETARHSVCTYFSKKYNDKFIRGLRINGIRTFDGLKDIIALINENAVPDLLFLPKTESAEELKIIEALLPSSFDDTQFIALIESAKGLSAANEIACATPRLYALMFGGGDFSADIGAALEWEPLLFARSRLIQAAAIGRVEIIDVPYANLADDRGLQPELLGIQKLGFTGKAAIHPKHIAAINAAFTPTEAEVAKAYQILSVNQQGVGVMAGQLVDEAIARKARKVIAYAETVKK